MTEIKTTTDKVILNGHANTQEECETITLLANALKQSTDFRTIKYESGYAEFEKVGKAEDLKFEAVPIIGELTINFDENIDNVACRELDAVWNSSGATVSVMGYDTVNYIFVVQLSTGYIIDRVTLDVGNLDGSITSLEHTDNTFTITTSGIGGTITLTSRKAVVEPTFKFKHRYKYDALIGSGAIKFRHYSVAEPVAQPTTFTFSIDKEYYTAEEGMTWEQWVGSDYNTARITTGVHGVYNFDDTLQLSYDGGSSMVNATDEIQETHYFWIE